MGIYSSPHKEAGLKANGNPTRIKYNLEYPSIKEIAFNRPNNAIKYGKSCRLCKNHPCSNSVYFKCQYKGDK